MAIAASGLASGLPVDDIISKLMAVERRPADLLTERTQTFQNKLSSLGKVKSAMSALQTALASLKDPLKVMPLSASITDSGIAGVSVTSSKASAGTYSLQVTSLAQQHKLLNNTVANSTTAAFSASGGTLNIKLGSATGVDVTIAAGASLEDIRNSINASDAGVTASIYQTTPGQYQLMVASKKTGSDQAITMTGVAELATASGWTVKSPAQDAQFSVDGVSFTRSSNSVSDAVLGMQFDLKATGSTSMTVQQDTTALKKSIQDIVTAYNSLRSTIKAETAYDIKSQKGKPLTGESMVAGLTSSLRAVFSQTFNGLRAGDIGLQFDKDGVLSLDSTKLDAAVAKNADDVAAFFVSVDPVSKDKVGFAAQLDGKITSLLKSDGLLATKEESINKTLTNISKQKEQMELRLTQTEANYRKQFDALEVMSSKMSSLGSFITQQLVR